MSVADAKGLMDRYFAAMGAGEDFSEFFDPDVTWLMTDTAQEIRGPAAVRDYILQLHDRMRGGHQRELAIADGYAILEGTSINATDVAGPDLTYCLVYELAADQILAMRCYGTLARLMSPQR